MFVAQLTKSADEGDITERTLCYIAIWLICRVSPLMVHTPQLFVRFFLAALD
jgi:hypothetical protein